MKPSPFAKQPEDRPKQLEKNLAQQLVEEAKDDSIMPEKATILEGEHGQTGMVCLWSDGKITCCVGTDSPIKEEAEKGVCYTSSKPGGEDLYYIALAHFSGLGFKTKEVETT